MHDCLWKLDGVTLDGDRRARLCEIGLGINVGHTAVVGPSGAGKTSLLNLLVEFEKPSRGTIRRATFSEDRLPVFWVPATGGLWPHLSVQEHLQFVAPEAEASEESASMLKQFDLAEKAHAYPDALSEGERTRLAIARALAADAAVLVMDEPLANVDITRAYDYWRVIRTYCAQHGTSLVFASHSVETVLREAENVVCLSEGRVNYAGELYGLYHQPASRELAEILGPANWFSEADEAQHWFAGASSQVHCYRPEHVKVERQQQSPLRVVASRYGSSLAELEVHDERSQASRLVFHRPNGSGGRFRVGERVVMRVLDGDGKPDGNDE